MKLLTKDPKRYELNGKMVPIEYYEMRLEPNGTYTVLGWGKYDNWSVLAGQARKMFIANCNTQSEAEREFGPMNWYSTWTSPQVSLNHLPGEDDPVPGGMYPDDWT